MVNVQPLWLTRREDLKKEFLLETKEHRKNSELKENEKLLELTLEGWERKGLMTLYEGVALEKRVSHLFYHLRQVGKGWVD